MSYTVGTIIRIKSVPESTVIVLKDGDVLELRREKHTTGFHPNTWRSVDEWRSSISEDAVLEIESRFLSVIAEPDKFTKRVCETFGKLCIKSTCRSQPTLAERIAKKKEEIDDFLREYPSLEQPHTPVTIFTGPLQTLSCLQSELHGYENELNAQFFSLNSGLDSRFVWRFKIDNYVAKDLWEIFKKKVDDCKWKIGNVNGEKWFQKNYDI